jgi:phosphatidylglycerophosphatase A
MDRLAYLLATGAGAGLLPLAPGTFGSLEGVAIFAGISVAARMGSTPHTHISYWLLLATANFVVFGVGVWASGRASRLMGSKDPSQVVIDEVSGQMISLTAILFAPTWQSVLLGFILFRAFDIFKPYPIRKLERLPGGWGIMADDVGAGILAALILLVARSVRIV